MWSNPNLMDTRQIRLCHLIWYCGFSRDGHVVDVPEVHAVGGFPVVDVAELVVQGQVEHALKAEVLRRIMSAHQQISAYKMD